ncbi:conjugal transfer protein [Lactococcus lactis subsp. lactis]|uniref:conjugal transfer protein n=1 Tax=Lactococcus lactis TaxID=1358 RepID=UPI00223ACCAA|nr:conjugal transfer protein [Lactococcus lactis]MCT0016756.1 conjugal transfer protein [Lactococcus lactis subsp. lactis]
MNDEIYYDYSIGLDMPFWLQEIRTPKGKLIWAFETPIDISFFVVMILSFIFMMIFLTPLLNFIGKYTMSMPMVLYVIIPWRLGRMYCEFEPDGKKTHYFIFGALRFFRNFALNSRPIMQEERRDEPMKKIIFEKTNI